MHIKEELAICGDSLMVEFCLINNLPIPKLNLIYDKESRDHKIIKKLATCGYYRDHKINVAVWLCANQNPMYSWAGYISDRTPYGVIQHELGHYVDHLYSIDKGRWLSDSIRNISKEDAITSYCPNTSEWFAEIFRLFLTNPELLKEIRPKAYDAIVYFDYLPVIRKSSLSVLEYNKAPQRIFDRLRSTKLKLGITT